MADLTEDLAGLTDAIVRPLVDEADELDITASETEDGNIIVEIRVNPEDAGKVIGRQGRVIKAIRTLARAAASRSGKLVDVELID
ncbi:KH domain-containing protein [Adlercreutzia sp. R25]|uniref:RNA-binding protein KhpA n=1 Tax=Adlercreutzia shanghongiae TaxID=3111773 RepID=A0ABU6IZK5_9ACTN|nr:MULTISPECIES: KH domain-containing protein [unclassified Adlercreutzia]MEC4273882.1 KH domain-containing protein [Adlercreutzia sp. R25]MEC4295281.1 KH domain-containing protein [Adlercreutzia sp. R22]